MPPLPEPLLPYSQQWPSKWLYHLMVQFRLGHSLYQGQGSWATSEGRSKGFPPMGPWGSVWARLGTWWGLLGMLAPSR